MISPSPRPDLALTISLRSRQVFEFQTWLPGTSRLTIEVKDYDTIGRDDLIGATAIDLEDRVFHPAWQAMPLKPLEWRPLRSRRSKTPQGSLQLWVEQLA